MPRFKRVIDLALISLDEKKALERKKKIDKINNPFKYFINLLLDKYYPL